MTAQEVRNKAVDGVLAWRSAVAFRYSNAYLQAYEEYQRVMREQAEADKQRAELIVAAASILGGSVLMATLGQTSLRAVAGNAMLHFVCNRNLERTFSAMAIAAENKAFMFSLGKLLDTVKERTTTAIKTQVQSIVTSNAARVTTAHPQRVQNDLFEALDQHQRATNLAADQIAASSLPAATKTRAFRELLAAPICNAPRQEINEAELAKKIELSFYMKAVLDADRLVTFGPAIVGSRHRDMREQPIPQAPSAPDYPRPPRRNPMEAQQIVVAGTLPGRVEARLETLHRQVFGSRFRAERAWINLPWRDEPEPGDLARAELRAAETRLDQLGAMVRPASLLQVRS